MPFTALKPWFLLRLNLASEVVRRLMPFTALKPRVLACATHDMLDVLGCAPPNAVYGIETTVHVHPHIKHMEFVLCAA